MSINSNYNKKVVDHNLHGLNLLQNGKYVQFQPHSNLKEDYTFAMPDRKPEDGESLTFDATNKSMMWATLAGPTGLRGPIGPRGNQGPTGPAGGMITGNFRYTGIGIEYYRQLDEHPTDIFKYSVPVQFEQPTTYTRTPTADDEIVNKKYVDNLKSEIQELRAILKAEIIKNLQ
jgi:hypothetical protein